MNQGRRSGGGNSNEDDSDGRDNNQSSTTRARSRDSGPTNLPHDDQRHRRMVRNEASSPRFQSPLLRASPDHQQRHGKHSQGANQSGIYSGAPRVPVRSRSMNSQKSSSSMPMLETSEEPEHIISQDSRETGEEACQRTSIAIFRGGKQWNILEDTPVGHAVARLVIVPGIETNEEDVTDEGDSSSESDECDDFSLLSGIVENDDDSLGDADATVATYGTEVVNGSYPYASGQISQPAAYPEDAKRSPQPLEFRDRFSPSFVNSGMWPTAGGGSMSNIHGNRGSSNFGNSQNSRPHHREQEQVGYKNDYGYEDGYGGREKDRDRRLVDLGETPPQRNGTLENHFASNPESNRFSQRARPQRRHSNHYVPSRHNANDLRMDDLRYSLNDISPTVRAQAFRRQSVGHVVESLRAPQVPAQVSTHEHVRSPISWDSSGRQPNQNPARRRNSLDFHVGRYEQTSSDDDEHTLGNSTITTNFTNTQRSRTISSRSLFRSDQMSHSEIMQIPRRRADSDDSRNNNAR